MRGEACVARRVISMKVRGQPCGGKGSQTNYIRDPVALVAIARTWYAIAMVKLSDDG